MKEEEEGRRWNGRGEWKATEEEEGTKQSDGGGRRKERGYGGG